MLRLAAFNMEDINTLDKAINLIVHETSEKYNSKIDGVASLNPFGVL
jgi:hypothetical protein